MTLGPKRTQCNGSPDGLHPIDSQSNNFSTSAGIETFQWDHALFFVLLLISHHNHPFAQNRLICNDISTEHVFCAHKAFHLEKIKELFLYKRPHCCICSIKKINSIKTQIRKAVRIRKLIVLPNISVFL